MTVFLYMALYDPYTVVPCIQYRLSASDFKMDAAEGYYHCSMYVGLPTTGYIIWPTSPERTCWYVYTAGEYEHCIP